MCSVSPATLVALAIAALAPLLPSSDNPPQFRLGFKLVADQIPSIVGRPLEEEHHNPLNGDAIQSTSAGLMVWRKADNWTAFTDGWRSWVNGPLGLQERGNDERFPWEAAILGLPPTATPRPTSPPPVATSRPTATMVDVTPTPRIYPGGVLSSAAAGDWVTSTSSRAGYYTTRDSSYWKSWAEQNRIWFAAEADLLNAFPGRTRR
ncbi:MAG TPA: hypothetical protein VHS28_10725 [Chloroflexota bacterium]|nr:hypothetical protein [Chloroflexota bacterium]